VSDLPRPRIRPATLLIVYGGMLTVALVWSALFRTLPRWLGDSADIPLSLAIGAGCGLGVVALTAALTEWVRPFRRLSDLLAGLIGRLSWPLVVLAAVASAVGEETLFRGALQSTLGLIPASLIFGLCHILPDRRALPWTVFALAAGFGLGALYSWRGGLAAPIAAHFVVNLINLRLIGRRVDGGAEPAPGGARGSL